MLPGNGRGRRARSYLAVLVAHDPCKVPLAGRAVVENGRRDAAPIFKVSGGKRHEMEAMGFMAAYGSKTGWEK